MLSHYDQSADHLLPVWELQANETRCMIGYHAVPVIVDAYTKGSKVSMSNAPMPPFVPRR